MRLQRERAVLLGWRFHARAFRDEKEQVMVFREG